MSFDSYLSIAGAVIATDFGLALKRPTLHLKLSDTVFYSALLIAVFGAGTWIGADITIDKIGSEYAEIIAPQKSEFFEIGLAGVLVILFHGFSALFRDVAAETKPSDKHSDRRDG